MFFFLFLPVFLFGAKQIFISNVTTQTHVIQLTAGQYVVECYGGQGGCGFDNGHCKSAGGKGAFTKGIMDVTGEIQTFYAHVGGKGSESKAGPNLGGDNGGGSSGRDRTVAGGDGDDCSGGGGGATDLRYNGDAITDRIIVAAGGSGGVNQCKGAPGGCLYGYKATSNNVFEIDYRINQTGGVKNGTGQNGDNSVSFPGSGAGGGWRGGFKTQAVDFRIDSYKAVSTSGSSFISGYNGCRNKSIIFKEGVMTAGKQSGVGKIIIKINFNCSNNCIGCSSADVCTKCKTDFVLHNNSCIKACPDGYYKSGSKCAECRPPCAKCSSSSISCNSCIDGYFLNGTKCLKVCPDGFYASSTSKKCLQCNKECKLCNSSSINCFACAENYTLNNNRCITKCIETNGVVQVGNTCQPCISSCKTCSPTPLDCTSCKEGFYLHENKCVIECPNKFFGENGTCVRCEPPCETCNSKEKCVTCSKGYRLSNGNCADETIL